MWTTTYSFVFHCFVLVLCVHGMCEVMHVLLHTCGGQGTLSWSFLFSLCVVSKDQTQVVRFAQQAFLLTKKNQFLCLRSNKFEDLWTMRDSRNLGCLAAQHYWWTMRDGCTLGCPCGWTLLMDSKRWPYPRMSCASALRIGFLNYLYLLL